MQIQIEFSNLRRTKPHEYMIRFVLGALVTLATGLVAHRFGPTAGGFFLAFPAIFPASATLVEKHETVRKQIRGLHGIVRGRRSAALDAIGASLGSLGLVAFAIVVWQLAPRFGSAVVLSSATLVWLVVSLLAWQIRRSV
jgi:hypothetical protein